jgi:hypothetical protein
MLILQLYIFFHNIEKHYTEEEIRVNPTWKNHLIAKVTAYNEKLSCKHADKLILLNQRDNLLLKKIYNREANILLPTTFIDKYNRIPIGLWNELNVCCKKFEFELDIEGFDSIVDPELTPEIFEAWVWDFFKDHPKHCKGGPKEIRDYQISSVYNILKFNKDENKKFSIIYIGDFYVCRL